MRCLVGDGLIIAVERDDEMDGEANGGNKAARMGSDVCNDTELFREDSIGGDTDDTLAKASATWQLTFIYKTNQRPAIMHYVVQDQSCIYLHFK